MSSKLRHIAMFSGMTILGDGSVIMVVDPNVLAQSLGRAARSLSEASTDTAEREPKARHDTVSLLIFRAASDRPKAVPLSLVSRIEEIDCRNIEIAEWAIHCEIPRGVVATPQLRHADADQAGRDPACSGVFGTGLLD